MADTTTKQFIDGLIDDIWNADVPESVTNEMVARVFDYLNKGYGDLGTAINVESVDDVDGIIADGIYYLNIAGNPGNVLIVRKQTAAGSIGGTATKGVATQYLFGPTDLSFRRGSYVRSHSGNTVDWDDWVKVEQKGAGNIINVSELVPPESGSYTFATAVAAVPEVHRALGRWITYRLSSGKWETKRFAGSDLSQWENTDAWEDTGGKGNITGVKVNGKTIIPDTSGVVNIVDELKSIIGEISREHVKVKVVATDGSQVMSTAGAVVCLDVFDAKSFPIISLPHKELICNENGEVEFDIPYNLKYALFSKVEGLGASFQYVYNAAFENREITLFNMPVGIFHCHLVDYYTDNQGTFSRLIPCLTYTKDLPSEQQELWLDGSEYEYVDGDKNIMAIVFSSSETSFAIFPKNFKTDIKLCPFARFNPLVIKPNDYKGGLLDYDGNMNTSKILAVDKDAPAPRWCREYAEGMYQGFVPSLGQLKLMLDNYEAINALMNEMNEAENAGFHILPYEIRPGVFEEPGNEYGWYKLSSTCYGIGTRCFNRGNTLYNVSVYKSGCVLAVVSITL